MDTNNWQRHSNLQCFLDSTTPCVISQSLPKTCVRDLNSLWQPIDKEKVDYFSLGDLWDHYYEWSAYGAGVPILLTGSKTVVQYYVPYLSAIQIYTSESRAALRNVGDDSESDSWSDDSESEKLSRSWDAVSEDSVFDPDGSWPARDRLGHLYFQYIEQCPPYGRIPLADKVTELARNYPGLTSFRSVELSPASWMSVSWYPIYHIPARRNVKDLCASFLTYHSISSSFQDNIPEDTEKGSWCAADGKSRRRSKEASNCISLPPFGLATYKMQGNLWVNPESRDHERIIALYRAADSWLKRLRVQHNDFNYFTTHPM